MLFSTYEGTGDIMLDMEQQFKANCIRIHILEQENSSLQNSLEKLKDRALPHDVSDAVFAKQKIKNNDTFPYCGKYDLLIC